MLKEIRKIDTSKLRLLCIKHEFYTNGNCKEYYNMFDMCKGNATTEKLESVATDIFNHTVFNYDWTDAYGKPSENKSEYIAAIAFYIVEEACYSLFEME